MNFDRVAHLYDATRGLPAEVESRVAEAVINGANAGYDTRFLEIGVGTGRIALPIAAHGFPYTGIDISEEMMAVLREKAGSSMPNLRIVHGDVTALPFAPDSFDVVLCIHLLHLVPEWKQALAEARRVTTPGGFFVFGGNGIPEADPGRAIRGKWYDLARETGAELRAENGSKQAIEGYLTEQGCLLWGYIAAEWSATFRPADLLEQLRARTFSHSWAMSDEAIAAVHERMLTWARQEYGDLDALLESRHEFAITLTRWPKG